jgi:hypothetical protein
VSKMRRSLDTNSVTEYANASRSSLNRVSQVNQGRRLAAGGVERNLGCPLSNRFFSACSLQGGQHLVIGGLE